MRHPVRRKRESCPLGVTAVTNDVRGASARQRHLSLIPSRLSSAAPAIPGGLRAALPDYAPIGSLHNNRPCACACSCTPSIHAKPFGMLMSGNIENPVPSNESAPRLKIAHVRSSELTRPTCTHKPRAFA